MYRWRVVSPVAGLRGRGLGEVSRLADATAAAESFLLAGPDTGDVAVLFSSQPGVEPEWVPQAIGVQSGGSVTWHPWPPDWLPSTELVALAKEGGDLETASGQGGMVAAVVGGDSVTVLTEPRKPSMVAKVAAQNAELFAAEAAGQAIPGEQVDAIPLTAAPPTTAINAPLVARPSRRATSLARHQGHR
jgi:hypothetical protein